ncbi:carbohydrate ABC transporter permease [Peribacillus muralis]|uniref:carbohydrate ABC transporter permease n=1 Tax=Peribacillus muralis TaxID=264697 RepID=UPI00366DF852
MKDKYAKYLLLAPGVFILISTIVYPIVQSFWISLHEWNLTESSNIGSFIGIENFLRAFRDPEFMNSLRITIIFTILTVFLSLLFSLGISLLFSKEKKHYSYIRAFLVIPFAMSPILVSFSWRFMLDPEYGLFHAIIGFFVPSLSSIVWLGQSLPALISVISVVLWIWVPFITLILVSGIMAIPGEIYEAANIDGANSLQKLFTITFPMLKPIIGICIILQTMFALKVFDPIVALTEGGPGNSTNILNYNVYQTGFRFFDMGYASAIAYILVIILVCLAGFYMRILMKGDNL